MFQRQLSFITFVICLLLSVSCEPWPLTATPTATPIATPTPFIITVQPTATEVVDATEEPPASIIVGSKQDTEQSLLGYILVLALEKAGFQVKDRTGEAGYADTLAMREALEAGEIDLQWESTGTALSVIHEFPMPDLQNDPDTFLRTVKRLDEAQGLLWLGRLEYNYTHTLVVLKDLATKEGINTLQELANFMKQNDSALKLCASEHFQENQLPALQKEYNLIFKNKNIQMVEHDQTYQSLRDDQCDVVSGHSTDGYVSAWEFQILEDTRRIFSFDNPALVIRQAILQERPEVRTELANLLSDINPHLDETRMSQLNGCVELGADGEPNSGDEMSVEEVAGAFLEKERLDCLPPEPTATPPGQVCEELVLNGDFESDEAWELPASSGYSQYTTEVYHSGGRAMQLGLVVNDDYVSHSPTKQLVQIPSNVESATLSYWYYSQNPSEGDEQGAQIYSGDESFVWRQLQKGTSNEEAWIKQEHDLSALIGEEIYLYFYLQSNGDGRTSAMYLDEVSLQVCSPSPLPDEVLDKVFYTDTRTWPYQPEYLSHMNRGKYYIPVQGENKIAIIDPDMPDYGLKFIETEFVQPHHPWIVPGMRYVYINFQSEGKGDHDAFAVLDTWNDEIIKYIHTGTNDPFHGAFSPVKNIYVTGDLDLKAGRVHIFDTETHEWLASIETTGIQSRDVLITHDGRYAFIGHQGYDSEKGITGAVDLLDIEKQEIIKSFGEGRCRAGKMSNNGALVFYSCDRTDEIVVIDTETLEEVKRIKAPEGSAPFNLSFRPDDKYAYVGLKGAGELAVVDVEKLEIVKTLESGTDTNSTFFHPYAPLAVVSNDGTDTHVSILDTEKNEIIDQIETGDKGTHYGQWFPDGRWFIISNRFGESVTLLKYNDEAGKIEWVDDIVVGFGAAGIHWTPYFCGVEELTTENVQDATNAPAINADGECGEFEAAIPSHFTGGE